MLIKSEKDKDLMLCDGYIYYIVYRYTTDTIRWKCVNKDCRAFIYTPYHYENLDFDVEIHGEYIEEADFIRNDRRYLIYKILSLAISDCRPPKKIVNGIVREFGYHKVRLLGKFETIFRTIQRHREVFNNPKPYRFPELNLSEKLSKTFTKEEFYRYGPGNYHNLHVYEDILIFYSDPLTNVISENLHFAIDGTFEVCPEPYHQLVTIGALSEHLILPCIYAILPSKRLEDYKKLFYLIRKMIPQFQPSSLKLDFESGLITAINIYYLSCRISGCLFHLSQAVDRQIKTSGLSNLYKTNFNIKKFTKSLLSLAFVAINEVENTYNALRQHVDFPIALAGIYEYFKSNYIRGVDSTRFPLEVWNLASDQMFGCPRTNNAIEGYHYMLKRSFLYQIYSFVNLIYQLRENESDTRILLERINNDDRPVQKNDQIRKQENLISYLYEHRNSNHGIVFVFDIIFMF